MREFASTRYRLSSAPRWQKVLYGGFLLFMLFGVGSSIALGVMRTGLTPSEILHYYRGNPETMQFEKTAQELLDVTHAHAFMMPMVLLVLGHLFLLTGLPDRWKRGVLAGALLFLLLELILPWAVRFGAPGWAYLKWVSACGFGAALLCMISVPAYEMWRKR